MTTIKEYMIQNGLLNWNNIKGWDAMLEKRMEWVKANEPFTTYDFSEAFHITPRGAKTYLDGLIKKGLLESTPHVSLGRHGSLPKYYRERR